MENPVKWKYCVIGNIVGERIDSNGRRWRGTSAFSAGTKVYLCGKYWNPASKEIDVIGMTRGKKYRVVKTDPACIENLRCSRAYHPKVLEIMDNYEMSSYWWDDSEEDKIKTAIFVYNWKTGFSLTKTHVLTQFYNKRLTGIRAYGIDGFDFCKNLLGLDFSVGQFGYAALEFGGENIYISTDGLSTVVPPRNNIKELQVDKSITEYFVGNILESIEYDGEEYGIFFRGWEMLRGHYEPNDGLADRAYFEIDWPY